MDTRVMLSGFDKYAEYTPETAMRIIQPVFDWFERSLGSDVRLHITYKPAHGKKHTLKARLLAEGFQHSAEVTGHDVWQVLSAVLEKLKNGVQHSLRK